MTTVWHNPMLSLDELAELTGFSVNTLRMWTDEAHDPLPSIQPGAHKKVLYSDFCEWAKARFGNGGYLRGMETFERKGRGKKRAG